VADLKPVSLDTIAEGAAVELFDGALAEILRDIDNPNTAPETVRTITLEFKFKPDEQRESMAVLVSVKTKAAGPCPAAKRLWIGHKGGQLVALEADPVQIEHEALGAVKGGRRGPDA